jgi:hypothetical protein
MAEMVAVFVLGAAVGALIGGAFAYEAGWKAAMSWALNKWSGQQ